jgi:hypothetical protein
MNTSVTEQLTQSGQRTFPVIFGLQLEAFECFQKLTHLNVAAFKATLDDARGALSSGQLTSAPLAANTALPQQLIERGVAYTQHVQEIEAKFQGAVIQAGQALYEQCSSMWPKFSGNLVNGEGFGSNALMGAMQPAIDAINRSIGTMHESLRSAGGTPFSAGKLVPVEA